MDLDLFANKDEYHDFVLNLKARIQSAQTHAALAVNRELVLLYWNLGHEISEKMRLHGWGDKVLDRLASDLQTDFPGIQGFYSRNLY